MKNKKIRNIFLIALTVVVMCVAFVGCASEVALLKGIDFEKNTLEKVVVVADSDNSKTYTHENDLTAIKDALGYGKVKKYTKKTDVKQGVFTVNLYFKDQKGFVKYTLNKGFEAIDGCKVDAPKGDFYLTNYDEVETALREIFY